MLIVLTLTSEKMMKTDVGVKCKSSKMLSRIFLRIYFHRFLVVMTMKIQIRY